MPDDNMPKVDLPGNADGGSAREKAKRPTRAAASPNEERIKLKPVVTEKVTERKKGWFKRFSENLTGDDTQTVAHYVASEVLLPAFKTMVTDAVSQGIERMMFGEVRGRSSGRSSNYTSYGSYSRDRPTSSREEPRAISRGARTAHDFREVVVRDRAEAEEVIDRLVELIDRFGVATVADFYDLVGVTGSWTDQKYGWDDLRDARARPVRGGYELDLPRTIQLT